MEIFGEEQNIPGTLWPFTLGYIIKCPDSQTQQYL